MSVDTVGVDLTSLRANLKVARRAKAYEIGLLGQVETRSTRKANDDGRAYGASFVQSAFCPPCAVQRKMTYFCTARITVLILG
jgi:hypothetical protein